MSVTLLDYPYGECCVCENDATTIHCHKRSAQSLIDKPRDCGCDDTFCLNRYYWHHLCGNPECARQHAGDDERSLLAGTFAKEARR